MLRLVTEKPNILTNEVKGIIDEYVKKLDIDPITAGLLYSRGLKSLKAAKEYLHCDEASLHDPFLLDNMQAAVDRIKTGIEKDEKITLYADYDADGMSACAALLTYMRSINVNVSYYIPSRNTEGYGLNETAVREIANNGTHLIITLDCGITSLKEVALANELGLDVIVTDHHQCPMKLPDCIAVINPLLGNYPYRHLCGAGVAAKLIHALSGLDAFMDVVEIACIGTVADVVPLTGENRAIAALGLKKMNEKPRTGIAELIKVSGIEGEIKAHHIAFMLAPRLNAAGRISDAGIGVSLLTEKNKSMCKSFAKELDEENKKRQTLESDILTEALKLVEAQTDLRRDRCIVLSAPSWNRGVIGIVASRLVEKYHRPTILFQEEGDYCCGSARSIPGVHIYKALNHFSSLMTRFGGHEQAAGMTIRTEDLDTLRKGLNRYLEQNYKPSDFIPRLKYDQDITLDRISLELIEQIKLLEPFGMGNTKPIFRVKGGIEEYSLVGKDASHVKCSLVDDTSNMEGIAFGMANLPTLSVPEMNYDILVSPEKNEWKGKVSPQCVIKSMKADLADPKNFEKLFQKGNLFSSALFNALPPGGKIAKADDRLRKIVRGDIYVTRRVQKDIYGTAFLCVSPYSALRLVNALNTSGIKDIDVAYGKKGDYTSIVLAPDWNADYSNCLRVVINDWCPMWFMEKLLSEYDSLEIVYLSNAERHEDMVRFLSECTPHRPRLLKIYSVIKDILSVRQVFNGMDELFQEVNDKTNLPYWDIDIALRVFGDLELVNIRMDDDVYVEINEGEKRDLSESKSYSLFEQALNMLEKHEKLMKEYFK